MQESVLSLEKGVFPLKKVKIKLEVKEGELVNTNGGVNL